MIEREFDIPFVAGLALREKQIQQSYRPIICVHKWFARRPGTLFRSLLLAEYAAGELREAFFRANDLTGTAIADPFMGGGTPLIEANRLGCSVTGYDINPMAFWIVRQELASLDVAAYLEAAEQLRSRLEGEVGEVYRTTCLECGRPDAHVKYFLWVKAVRCPECGHEVRLFPGNLVAAAERHPRTVFVCLNCGRLKEVDDAAEPGRCPGCGEALKEQHVVRRGKFECPHCEALRPFPNGADGPPRHRMFAMEYHCGTCKATHEGRFFKAPDEHDLARMEAARGRLEGLASRFVPEEAIPAGDETARLHRWGYTHYRQMFNERQLLGLELSCRFLSEDPRAAIREALATNLSDLLRYQNMLCRYDTRALKSLDVFSVHGFPVGLVQCESNLLGVSNGGTDVNVGSGGWSNMVAKFAAAKRYCENPYEIRHDEGRGRRVSIKGEWIGRERQGSTSNARRVDLRCADAATTDLPARSLDGVFTDPPYFGNVQYAELMDFCYVWLRRLVGDSCSAFQPASTRNAGELTGNQSMGRTIESFAAGLSAVFRQMAAALKPGKPLVFTYHHNDLDAYGPVAVALLDAGLVCSASLPCPAEMGASIHIAGTASSIVDSVFVCRGTGSVPRRWLPPTVDALLDLVRGDAEQLAHGGVEPTAGDIRCVAFGHLSRLAVWHLRDGWRLDRPVAERLRCVSEWIAAFTDGIPMEAHLSKASQVSAARGVTRASETTTRYGEDDSEVSF